MMDERDETFFFLPGKSTAAGSPNLTSHSTSCKEDRWVRHHTKCQKHLFNLFSLLRWTACQHPGQHGSKKSVTLDKRGSNNNPVETARQKKNAVDVGFVCSIHTRATVTVEITQINRILCASQQLVKVFHAPNKLRLLSIEEWNTEGRGTGSWQNCGAQSPRTE